MSALGGHEGVITRVFGAFVRNQGLFGCKYALVPTLCARMRCSFPLLVLVTNMVLERALLTKGLAAVGTLKSFFGDHKLFRVS